MRVLSIASVRSISREGHSTGFSEIRLLCEIIVVWLVVGLTVCLYGKNANIQSIIATLATDTEDASGTFFDCRGGAKRHLLLHLQ